MNNKEQLNSIIKELNDNRSKLSALYSLYNSSLIVAEDNRQLLSSYYEQMMDLRNDLSEITNSIINAKKSERESALNKNKSKIKNIGLGANELQANFNDGCAKYKVALKECGSLKSEYKHEVSELCKQFKAIVESDSSVEPITIKGYKQQVRIIKAIFDKIEMLISDYNVKKNKVETDNQRFGELYQSVNSLIVRLKTTA